MSHITRVNSGGFFPLKLLERLSFQKLPHQNFLTIPSRLHGTQSTILWPHILALFLFSSNTILHFCNYFSKLTCKTGVQVLFYYFIICHFLIYFSQVLMLSYKTSRLLPKSHYLHLHLLSFQSQFPDDSIFNGI